MRGHPEPSLTYSLENVYMEQLTTHAKHSAVENMINTLPSLIGTQSGAREMKNRQLHDNIVKMKYDEIDAETSNGRKIRLGWGTGDPGGLS